MKYVLISTFAFAVGLQYVLSAQIHAQSPVSPTNENRVNIRDLLTDLGNRYGCYFTMEISPADDYEYSFENVRLPHGSLQLEFEGKNRKDALEWLRGLVPDLRYKVSASNGNIVHIFDSRLVREKRYSMEETVASIQFDGLLYDLPNEIGKKRLAVASKNFGDTRDLADADYSTKVRINEKAKKVRDIITSSIILEGRGRILWIAETDLGDGKTTFVKFFK